MPSAGSAASGTGVKQVAPGVGVGQPGGSGNTGGGGGGGTGGNAGGTQPYSWEDFSEYSSTSDLVNSSRCTTGSNAACVWANSSNFNHNTAQINLDATAAGKFGGTLPTGVTSTQSMRYDYPACAAGTCNDYTISLGFLFIDGNPPANADTAKLNGDTWWEWVWKLSSNWTNTNPPNGAGIAYKHVLFYTRPDGTRLGWTWENGEDCQHMQGYWDAVILEDESPSGVSTSTQMPSCLWDGNWHVTRMHAHLCTSSGSPACKFIIQVDGTTVVNEVGFTWDFPSNNYPTKIQAFVPGANLNQGPKNNQSAWFAFMGFWFSDPGWGI